MITDNLVQEVEDLLAQLEVYREDASSALEDGDYRALVELAVDMSELATTISLLKQFVGDEDELAGNDEDAGDERVF